MADCDIFAILRKIAPNGGAPERNEERMNYSLEDLKSELAAMEPGEETCVAYGQYALLFMHCFFHRENQIRVLVTQPWRSRKPTAVQSATVAMTILFAS